MFSACRWAVLSLALALCACRTAPRAAAANPESADGGMTLDGRIAEAPPQPGNVIATVGDIAVLALAAPAFDALPREQRLVAYWVSRAGAEGDAITWDQGYRHNLEIVHVLRGILSQPQVVPPLLLPRIRSFARLVYLNRGLHDTETGRKLTPPFSFGELRSAVLAAAAGGGDLRLRGASLEYALRGLEGALFDLRVDAQQTVRAGAADPIVASAVNLYDGVTARDVAAFRERYPLNSRLAKGPIELVERGDGLHGDRLLRAASALDQALPFATAPQRAVLEPLAAYLRSGEPDRFRAAEQAWVEANAPVDFLLGFLDTSADPRSRKALFGALVGIADPARAEPLRALAQAAPQLEARLPIPPRAYPRLPAAQALQLAAAAGADRPLGTFAVALPLEDDPARVAVFAAAADAASLAAPLMGALADPALAPALVRCLPQHRLAFLALRELPGRRAPSDRLGIGAAALQEARADLVAHLLAQEPIVRGIGLIPDARCQQLWPQFAATMWFASAARGGGEALQDDRQRAVQLQVWWFTGKGALVERHQAGGRFLSAPDTERFRAAAAELLRLLDEIESLGDAARLRDLLEKHATRVDLKWHAEIVERLRAAGIPRRVAVLAPQLRPVLDAGKVIDAQAAPVDDLDGQILRDWSGF